MNEKIKEEALRRMKALNLLDEGDYTCVQDFKKNNIVYKSEFHGILYWLDEDEQKLVKDFEISYKDQEMLVYHCYKAHTEFGDILFMLYVSNEKGENERFDIDLQDDIIFTYAANMTEPCFSEFGSAYVKSQFGGIIIQ